MTNAAIRDTALFFNLTPQDIIGPSRHSYVFSARAITSLILRDRDRHSFNHIGRILGGRDHSTIHAAVQRGRELSATDEPIRIFVKDQLILPRFGFVREPIGTFDIPAPQVPTFTKVKIKNERCAEDTDAMNRYRGTVALGKALAKAMAERELSRGACASS